MPDPIKKYFFFCLTIFIYDDILFSGIKMKHRQTIAFFWLAAAIVIGCSSTASNTQPRTSQTASRGGETSGPYFTGSGGKGMSLAILVLESTGLNENQAYLPRMVQGDYRQTVF